MARSNKYASLNLNDIFERKLNNKHNTTTSTNQGANNSSAAKSFPNQSKTVLANSRIHGHMLVLSRPTPKPIPIPQKGKGSSAPPPPTLDQAQGSSDSGSISLRPQGRTGPGPALSSPPFPSPVSPLPAPVKSDRFVPPHLRPGFVGKKEKPGPELVKGGPGSFKGKPEVRGHRSGLDPIEIRPKSGGGYDPIRRDRELGDLNRAGSLGIRPSSSG